MIRSATLAITSLLMLVVLGCLAGCAQNVETPVASDQRQPQALAADQATSGVQVRNTWNINHFPAGYTTGVPSLTDDSEDQQADLVSPSASPVSAGLARAKAGIQSMNGLSFYVVTTGNGTGTQTPTLTGGTLTSSQTPTITPNQEPTANVTVPIAVGMPGSAPQASAQGQLTTGGTAGSMTLTPGQQAELRTLLANVKGGLPGAVEALAAFLSQPKPVAPAATTQPVP